MTPRKVPRHRPAQRENLRPPRYRLMTAAAKLPRRPPEGLTVAYDRACPACGRSVQFTQVHLPDRVDYLIEDHDCR